MSDFNFGIGGLFGGVGLGDSPGGGVNFADTLARLFQDPQMRNAFLHNAAMGADPSIMGLPPEPTPGAGIAGQTVADSLPNPASNPQSQFFDFAVSPDVAAQMQTNLPTSDEYAAATGQNSPDLGKMLAGAPMPKKAVEKPTALPAPSPGGASHGSTNKISAPGYLQATPVDPQTHRRATLAALLGSR